MSYLTYNEYITMGGQLDIAAYTSAEREAEYLINSQSAGQTGTRIAALPSIPQPVKDCVFALIEFGSKSGAQVASESQSQGGSSESVSYVTLTAEQILVEKERIVFDTFFGGGIGSLLYRGACI